MLTLTRKADYALLAMADLARRDRTRASAREIAGSVGVPLPVLTNILHQLLHRGLVSSAKGSKGGYQLAKLADEISLAEMIDAVEGPFKLTICCATEVTCDENRCNLEDNCQIKGPVRKVHQSLRRFFGQVTLAHIAGNSELAGPELTMEPSCCERERAQAHG